MIFRDRLNPVRAVQLDTHHHIRNGRCCVHRRELRKPWSVFRLDFGRKSATRAPAVRLMYVLFSSQAPTAAGFIWDRYALQHISPDY